MRNHVLRIKKVMHHANNIIAIIAIMHSDIYFAGYPLRLEYQVAYSTGAPEGMYIRWDHTLFQSALLSPSTIQKIKQ